MTLPYERARALMQAREFLVDDWARPLHSKLVSHEHSEVEAE